MALSTAGLELLDAHGGGATEAAMIGLSLMIFGGEQSREHQGDTRADPPS